QRGEAGQADGDGRRQPEPAVHGPHGVAFGVVGLDDVGADDGGDDADAPGQQREDQVEGVEHAAGRAEHDAQDHGGDHGDFKALENVGGHAGAIADVVAHKVGHDGGVTRV